MKTSIKNLGLKGVNNIFVSYFGDPVMTYIDVLDDFHMYAVKIRSFTINDSRYLIALCPKLEKKVAHLSELKCSILQTRRLKTKRYHCKTHHYLPKNDNMYSKRLTLYDRTVNYTIYLHENLTVSLLHENNDYYDSPNIITLNEALETYRCVVEDRTAMKRVI